MEFWPCTSDLYSVLNVQDSVFLRVSAGRFSSWLFVVVVVHKILPLKVLKFHQVYLSWGQLKRTPSIFHWMLSIYSKNKIML